MNHLYQINSSKGGVPKLPVETALITYNGLDGDIQKDKRYHGGPNRAISLFSYQLIEKIRAEGHPIYPGSTGENLTLWFPNYEQIAIGDKLQIGNKVILQITSYAAPCKTIKNSFLNEIFIRISHKVYPNQSRLYTKVLVEGEIKKSDSVYII